MQKPERPRNLVITFFAILLIGLSFFRDHVFKSVNEQLRLTYYNGEQYPYSFLEPWLKGFSYEKLNDLKFILTFIFSLAFLMLTLWLVNSIFRSKIYVRYTIFAYATVFILAAGFYAAGYLFPSAAERLYTLSRFLSEFLQSPLLTMILCAAFILDTKSRTAS